MNKSLDKLYKIAYQEHGQEKGEKRNAKILLIKRLKKLGIPMKDFMLSQREKLDQNTYFFSYKSEWERRLIIQVAAFLNKNCYTTLSHKGRKLKKLAIDFNQVEKAEFDSLLLVMKADWEEQLDYFFQAFIQKNNLFRPGNETHPPKKLSKEELEKMAKIINMTGVISESDKNIRFLE